MAACSTFAVRLFHFMALHCPLDNLFWVLCECESYTVSCQKHIIVVWYISQVFYRILQVWYLLVALIDRVGSKSYHVFLGWQLPLTNGQLTKLTNMTFQHSNHFSWADHFEFSTCWKNLSMKNTEPQRNWPIKWLVAKERFLSFQAPTTEPGSWLVTFERLKSLWVASELHASTVVWDPHVLKWDPKAAKTTYIYISFIFMFMYAYMILRVFYFIPDPGIKVNQWFGGWGW